MPATLVCRSASTLSYVPLIYGGDIEGLTLAFGLIRLRNLDGRDLLK